MSQDYAEGLYSEDVEFRVVIVTHVAVRRMTHLRHCFMIQISVFFENMKTTLNLRDDLVVRAKATAAREATTLTKLIEEGLAIRLRRQSKKTSRAVADLPYSNETGGLKPGIDGISNRSLFDAEDS
jgi:hypothetical protein